MARARILLIDDDPATTECYRELLEEANLEVAVAMTQAQACSILDTGKRFQLILVDHSLKGLESIEFITALRKSYPPLKKTVIAVFSGHASRGLVAEKVRAADGIYIEKPSDIDVFAKLVEELLLRVT